jgi:hypothetical protein
MRHGSCAWCWRVGRVPVRAACRRPIPGFIADASAEGLPYGRWGQRLRDEFARACEPHLSEAGGEVTRFPEPAWGGRVYVSAVAPVEGTQEPSEYFGFVSFFRATEGEEGPRGVEQFHWHLDIAPRIGIRAGFEMSTGVELNVFPPERAAAELREALT